MGQGDGKLAMRAQAPVPSGGLLTGIAFPRHLRVPGISL